MQFEILMGLPEMKELWDTLEKEHKDGSISKNDEELYKKWGSAMKKLSHNPAHPSLATHEIEVLTRRYGVRVWQSYLENKTSAARRMYWVYGPRQGQITDIGLEPHPEDAKNGAYDRIKLSDME